MQALFTPGDVFYAHAPGGGGGGGGVDLDCGNLDSVCVCITPRPTPKLCMECMGLLLSDLECLFSVTNKWPRVSV